MNLAVDGEDTISDSLSGKEALGRWSCAVASGDAAALEKRCCVVPGAKAFLDDANSAGGPPHRATQSRVTLDMHTHECIADHAWLNGQPPQGVDLAPFESGSADTITYFYYSPQTALEAGWHCSPTGVRAQQTPCSALANACAAVGWGFAWRAVSGELPHGLSFAGSSAFPDTYCFQGWLRYKRSCLW